MIAVVPAAFLCPSTKQCHQCCADYQTDQGKTHVSVPGSFHLPVNKVVSKQFDHCGINKQSCGHGIEYSCGNEGALGIRVVGKSDAKADRNSQRRSYCKKQRHDVWTEIASTTERQRR